MKDTFLNTKIAKINPVQNNKMITKKIDQEFKKVKSDLVSYKQFYKLIYYIKLNITVKWGTFAPL